MTEQEKTGDPEIGAIIVGIVAVALCGFGTLIVAAVGVAGLGTSSGSIWATSC